MNTKIRISGKILAELSEKIPTNIIALNELIKNSYDAGASFVTIEIDTIKKVLRIFDDGSGMTKKDIDMLFHISESNKIHGKKNKYGRITQGSKGLGFLSVFRFGKFVEWRTNNDKGYNFSVDFNQLISTDDISHFPIELFIDNSITKGTEIIIKMDNYNAKSLNDYFSLERNYKKIIYSFDDDNFIINLTIDDKSYSSKDKMSLLSNEKNRQLFYITYSSKTQKIIFKHNNHIILTETYQFQSNQYTLDIELLIFQLKSHGKEKIDKLFFNPNDDLTPLIYYNTNLFNNYTIFDPDIMRNIKTSQVLNQMIGFIRIISKNRLIDFNSDRSQFLQNELTDGIIKFLYSINRKIQETGSEMKNYLIKFDFLTNNEISHGYSDSNDPEEYRKLIKNDFFFKRKVKIAVYDNNITYSLFGKTATIFIKDDVSSPDTGNDDQEKKLLPVKINLYCRDEQDIPIPSDQINLRNYVESAYNSAGELIDNSEFEIKVDGKIISSGILSSIEIPCQKNIEYNYSDSETGVAIKKIKLIFKEHKTAIKSDKSDNLLISLPAKENYTINYNNILARLIDQLNKLSIDKNLEVISCSLRAIFEVSVASIYKSSKFANKVTREQDLENGVVGIIEYIKSNQGNVTKIDNATIIGFKNLNNLLDIDEFRKVIRKSHLGAHHASTLVTEPEIRYIAKYASLFILITNEMLNNANIV